MKTLEFVKEHFDEFEEDTFLDFRFTKRFLQFLPSSEWEKYGFEYTGKEEFVPKEWTEENILEQLKRDVFFGLSKAEDQRGISSELMATVVRAWCKVLENGCVLSKGEHGAYYIRQFTTVIDHYGWKKESEEIK